MHLLAGNPHTLGAVVGPDGVNFALAAPAAERVVLCLFGEDGQGPELRLDLPCCTDGVWHGLLPQAGAGLVYGYRVHGPWAPAQGQRFNPAKLLLDPAAREVLGRYGGEALHQGFQATDPTQADGRDNAALALKARVVDDLPAATGGVRVSADRRVIYELHVKGFSALHSAIAPELRGTYAGLGDPASIRHLQTLGITTLCIMPLAMRADEARLQQLGLSNYWGYSPIAWNAPEPRYWSGRPGTSARSELRAMVDALHAAGIEVILDVVYNHTGETDEWGPSLSLRGIDNATYYHLDPADPARYLNWTGCGNCVNLNHPLVLRTVMDSLRGWVLEFGVDGFRFDLAPVLARGTAAVQYRYQTVAPFLLALAQDPLLRQVLMVAEPWDIGPGGYQLGQFPPGWLEWNDRFRDTQRGFWLCAQDNLGELARRLAGSSDCFDAQRRRPHSSVNFVTAHDGFTLTDLVSYRQRHNLANGEDNRDGHGDNRSTNHGVEGPSDDPQVQAWRDRDRRTLLAVTLLSLGTPMLLAGDELGHSQRGNNNAYCQDNATTWLDWAQPQAPLTPFVARLIAARQQRLALSSASWWSEAGSQAGVQALWRAPDGAALTAQHWNDSQARAVAVHLHCAAGPLAGAAVHPGHSADCLLLCNASAQPVRFVLPPGGWWRHIDSASGDYQDHAIDASATVPAGSLWLASRQPLQPGNSYIFPSN